MSKIIIVFITIIFMLSCRGDKDASKSGGMTPTYHDHGYDLPDAKMKDRKLAQEIASALQREKWEYEIKQINITSSDWKIHKNVYGDITHRSVDTYIALKNADGVCKKFNISFKQVFNGKNYGITQVNGVGEVKEITCVE